MVHIVAQCLELFLEVLLARAEHVETLVPLRVLQLFAVFPHTVHLNRPVGNLLCVEGKRRHCEYMKVYSHRRSFGSCQ